MEQSITSNWIQSSSFHLIEHDTGCAGVYLTFNFPFLIDGQASFNIFMFTGYAYDPDCMYINGSGRDYYEFYIQLNRCGTLGKNSLTEDNRKNPTVSI